MPSVINTNVMSLNAQRNLSSSQSALKTSLERLSSGLRINSAKDDAAGLAIADRMTTQIRGMNQAVRNANDAISLAQTGEGALKQISSNLQRMRELAVQSANATNTASDRTSLNDEFQELLSENDRLAQTTSFNGQKVLDGSMGSANFQVGANVGETIGVELSSSMRTSSVGTYASKTYNLATDGTATDTDSFDLGAGEITINGESIAAATDHGNGAGAGSALSVAEAINAKTADHGVTATAGAATNKATAGDIVGFAWEQNAAAGDTYELSINGTSVLTQNFTDTNKTAEQLASAINTYSSTTGVVAKVDDSGDMTLTAEDGRNIEIKEVMTIAGADGTDGAGYFGNALDKGAAVAGTNFEISKGTLSLEASRDINITFTAPGGNDAEELLGLTSGTTNSNTAAQTLDSSDILTVSNSELAIKRIDEAISDVDGFRGTFGTIQSRFESTIASLQTTVENVSASRSRIQDADFAAETAELTRNQILQQAGTAMLAQANSAPQGVLSLLQ